MLFEADIASLRRLLTLDPESTIWALAFGAALLFIFRSARAIFGRGGGLRLVSRGLAWFGLALAAIMFVQRAITPGLIYGFWRPITRASDPAPLGPFVNRNDIATWLILGCPLVFGYAMARLESRYGSRSTPGVESLADSRTVWLGASQPRRSAGNRARTVQSPAQHERDRHPAGPPLTPCRLETPPGDEPVGVALAHLAFLKRRTRAGE